MQMTTHIGVISDTHGLFRPEVLKAFKGVDLILHGGDIGNIQVLKDLETIAPVHAVRGNNDQDAWAKRIPETKIVQANNLKIYLLHNVKELDIDPLARGMQVVISGHSHRPLIETRNSVLFLNPGSAGPRRFKLPITVARITIGAGRPRAKIIDLAV